MIDPNQPSISFEQVTNMLKEIEQTHGKIMSNTEAYRIQYRMLESLYSGLHSKLKDLYKPIENSEERLKVFNTIIKIPKVLPLATLLEVYGRRKLTVGILPSRLWILLFRFQFLEKLLKSLLPFRKFGLFGSKFSPELNVLSR
jgi:hypothetical protein